MGSLLAAVLVALFVREDGSPADSRQPSATPTLRRLGLGLGLGVGLGLGLGVGLGLGLGLG